MFSSPGPQDATGSQHAQRRRQEDRLSGSLSAEQVRRGTDQATAGSPRPEPDIRWIPDLHSLPHPRTRARVTLWRALPGNTALLQTPASRVQTLCPRPPLPGCPSGTVPQRGRDRSPLRLQPCRCCQSEPPAATEAERARGTPTTHPRRLLFLLHIPHLPGSVGPRLHAAACFPGRVWPLRGTRPWDSAVGRGRVLHPISSLTAPRPSPVLLGFNGKTWQKGDGRVCESHSGLP